MRALMIWLTLSLAKANSSYKKKEYSYCSFYGDEVYWNNKTGYSKYSKTYNYSKKYYSFNSKLIPEKKSSIVCHKNTPNSTL